MKYLIVAALVCASFFAGSAVSASADKTRAEIITDNAAGVVSIVIDGATIATFTAEGFRVNGDVDYAGTLTDTGPIP